MPDNVQNSLHYTLCCHVWPHTVQCAVSIQHPSRQHITWCTGLLQHAKRCQQHEHRPIRSGWAVVIRHPAASCRMMTATPKTMNPHYKYCIKCQSFFSLCIFLSLLHMRINAATCKTIKFTLPVSHIPLPPCRCTGIGMMLWSALRQCTIRCEHRNHFKVY